MRGVICFLLILEKRYHNSAGARMGYSGISDALLLKYIEDSRHIWEGNLKEIRYTTVGSVIGTHAGPGAVVVAFFKNQSKADHTAHRRYSAAKADRTRSAASTRCCTMPSTAQSKNG